MGTPVTRLTTVYGETVHVATADWDGLGMKSPLLLIYTRDGRKWGDTPAGQRAERKGTMVPVIHRDNLCPPNIARLGDVAKAAERLLAKLDTITTAEFERGGERAERDALRDALKMLRA